MGIQIKQSERVYLGGQSGSGKTTLASAFLASVPRLVAVDTIGDLSEQFPRMERWEDKDARKRFLDGEDVRLMITMPILESEKIPQWFDIEVAQEVLKVGNAILYIDEAQNVIPSQLGGYKMYSRMLFQQGRHYNVGTWISTQRPAGILKQAFSEARHYFIFTLSDLDDIAIIRRRFGWYQEPPDEHGFWYYTLRQNPVYYDELKVKYVSVSKHGDIQAVQQVI